MDGAWGYLWEMLGEGRQGLGANGVAYGRSGRVSTLDAIIGENAK